MRRFVIAALSLALLLASCADPFGFAQGGPQPAPASTVIPPSPTEAISHAPEIRIALIGGPGDFNVWSLFEEEGADYASHALMNDDWPRLYTLSIPERNFTPRAAAGFPAPVIQEGEFHTSTVTLRADLKWTDGSAFTAQDVAFTVNSSLAFELGFDWKAFYSPEVLASAEAVDATIVKYYFKQQPNVSAWQYGALQGPVVQKAYWESKIAEAAALLPDDALRGSIVETRARIAELQPIVDSLNFQLAGRPNRELSNQLKTNQGNLDEANNSLAEYLTEYADKIESAHQALYALDDSDEPILGVWMRAEKEQGNWVKDANPDFPFEVPNFDRVVYSSFDSQDQAFNAFEDVKMDIVLSPNGNILSTQNGNLSESARFLAINPSNSALADPALRQALTCMIWSPTRIESAPLAGFVLPGNDFWRNPNAVTPCADLTEAELNLRLERAVQFLKSAGYAWEVEPTKDAAGMGLLLPNGQPFPSASLLGPSEDVDPLQAKEAAWIESQANYLGIPVTAEYVSPQDVRYRVFSSKIYDMAIVGWRLSLYPGYLCEWFGGQGQFNDNGAGSRSECDVLSVESDLDAAREQLFNLQSGLVQDLSFIPLYADLTFDAYQNVRYPFASVLGGFTSLYGAPASAIPVP
jgi:peptide/nickel transport system substrate-binding protein